MGHKDNFCQLPLFSNQSHSKSRRGPSKTKPVTSANSLVTTFQSNATSRRKFLTVYINGEPVRLQLDTASDITVLSKSVWNKLGRPLIEQSSQTVISACGGQLHLHGQLVCCVSFREISFSGTCYVTNSNLNLLGLDWFDQLGLADVPVSAFCNQIHSSVTLQPVAHIVDQFPPLFQSSLGCRTVTQAVLKIQPNAVPIFRPKRPVPYASLPLIDAELKRLETEDVIVPVSYS